MKVTTAFTAASLIASLRSTIAGRANAQDKSQIRDKSHNYGVAAVNTKSSSNLRKLQDDAPCLSTWEVWVSDGCNFDSLVEELSGSLVAWAPECPHGDDAIVEMQLAFGKNNVERLENLVTNQCNKAVKANYREMEQFEEHLDDLVFAKAYFDGGTYMNDMRQTTVNGEQKHKLKDDPGNWIRDVYEHVSMTTVMNFPNKISNFDENCEFRAAMCCWVQDRQAGDGNGNCAGPYNQNCLDADPADNTDICYTDFSRAPQSSRVQGGFALFPGNSEGDTHCHGMAWTDDNTDPSNVFKGNNLFYVSMYDHLYQRGYVKEVPGGPMCACVEQMPVVTRADCTQIDMVEQWVGFELNEAAELEVHVGYLEIEFNECEGVDGNNNDLASHYELMVEEGKATEEELITLQETVVGPGNCGDAVENFVGSLN